MPTSRYFYNQAVSIARNTAEQSQQLSVTVMKCALFFCPQGGFKLYITMR
jgi:hypothetical protein